MTENPAHSTAVSSHNGDAKLRDCGGITAFHTEPGEGEWVSSSEAEALDSERRSFELKRRHVQMMAFGLSPLHTSD